MFVLSEIRIEIDAKLSFKFHLRANILFYVIK